MKTVSHKKRESTARPRPTVDATSATTINLRTRSAVMSASHRVDWAPPDGGPPRGLVLEIQVSVIGFTARRPDPLWATAHSREQLTHEMREALQDIPGMGVQLRLIHSVPNR